MNEYSKKLINLRTLCASPYCPYNIHEQYVSFWNEFKVMKDKSNSFFNYDNYELSLSDSYIYDLSEKRDIKGIYHTNFMVNASVYLDKSPINVQKIQLKLTSIRKMRELSNKEIYDFIIDEDKNEINIVYFKEGKLKVLNTNYITVQKELVPQVKNKYKI